MKKVLVINGSINTKEVSITHELGTRFLTEYQKHHQDDQITFLDLNEVDAGQDTLSTHTMKTYWNEDQGLKYISQLKAVDKLIILSPMYNFNISGLLKNYLDHVALANHTFSYKYSKKGDAIGLLDHLEVQILSAQGAPKGWYPWGDHVAYLQGTWNFLGAKVAEPILIAGVKTDPWNKMKPSEIIDTIHDEIVKKAAHF